jgi:Na+/proline symporter
MSTISSQLLVSSSSLTEDFYKTFVRRSASQKELVLVGRLSVLAVSIFAIGLAFDRSASILSLVSNAWAGFGAAFGPIILLSLFWRRFNRDGALAGMVTGAIAVLFWIYAPIEIGGKNLAGHIYEIVPGFLLSTIAAVSVTLLTSQPSDAIAKRHDHLVELMKGSNPDFTDPATAKTA